MQQIKEFKVMIIDSIRKHEYLALSIIVSMIPLAVLILLQSMYSFNIFNSKPTWNDEVSWYSQIQAVIEYGKPLGYYGYNGTHAQFGTFDPWGIAILLPYVVFGKVFGWHFYSPCYANLFFEIISNLIFIVLTKIPKKNLKYLAIANLFLYISLLYSLTAMSECLRYSMAIILCGLLYRLRYYKVGKIYKYVVVPVIVLYCIQAYVMFTVVIPIYICFVFKEKNIVNKILISIILTLIVGGSSYFILSKISCPYVESRLSNIITILNNNFFSGIFIFLESSVKDLISINAIKILSMNKIQESYGIISSFMMLYYVLLFYTLYLLFKKQDIKEDYREIIIIAWILVSFLLLFVMFYTTSSWTLVRGLNVALVFITYLACLLKQDKVIRCFCISSIICSIPFLLNLSFFMDNRYLNDGAKLRYENEAIEVSKYVKIDKENSPWQNTVSVYNGYDSKCLLLPVGIGYNYILNNNINEFAKYVLIYKNNHEKLLSDTLKNNHSVLYENNDFILLLNMRY